MVSNIFYVFGPMNFHPNWAWTAADTRLSREMMSSWINFARRGDPNGEALPYWPEYNDQDQEVMDSWNTIEAGQEPDKRRFD